MKQTFFPLLFTMVVYVASAQTEKEPYMVKSLSNESSKEFEARTSGGSISVNGATSDARIEVYVTATNNQKLTKDEIKQRLDELYELNISTGSNKLTATAKSKEQIRDWKKALNIA